MWQKILQSNFRSWEKLAEFLQIDPKSIAKKTNFPLNLPRRLANKIEKGREDDPILRQFLPLHAEAIDTAGFGCDPLYEQKAASTPRLLRKYPGRALLVTSASCAMHCRYCFRRHFAYAEGPSEFREELAVINDDPSLHELILSGGDPLSLTNRRLRALVEGINALSHIRLLRFHTRFVLGIPERIDQEFLELLEAARPQVWFVIHCNHARELDADILDRLGAIQRLGIPVLNQAVLLRGVNDNLTTLQELCLTLTEHAIQPYYLYQLDRVAGAAHFEVSSQRGLELVTALRDSLPGYAVPTFAKEEPGANSKSRI